MTAAEDPGPSTPPRPSHRAARLAEDVRRVDVALYAAVARTPTPELDRVLGRLTSAADHSKISMAAAALLAVAGGARGRRAAVQGLASVAVTSAAVNLGAKPIGRRTRPDRVAQEVPIARHVRMPTSSSFPSGHSAAAFAFANGVGRVWPAAGAPLTLLAALVAYSRVHTGVHYPGDVVVGSLLGSALAHAATHAVERRWAAPALPQRG